MEAAEAEPKADETNAEVPDSQITEAAAAADPGGSAWRRDATPRAKLNGISGSGTEPGAGRRPVTPRFVLNMEGVSRAARDGTPQSARRLFDRSGASVRGASSGAVSGTPTSLVVARQQLGTLELAEARLAAQMKQSDRIRDSALAGANSKLATLDSQQRRLDRSIAEISGACRGLSEELQENIRQVNYIETRMMDMKHSLEEEFRSRLAEFEDSIRKQSSETRVMETGFETTCRKLEQKVGSMQRLVDERLARLEPSFSELTARLCDLEDHAQAQSALASLPEALRDRSPSITSIDNVDAALPLDVSTKLSAALEKCDKIDRLLQDSQDVHMQLSAQEERLNLVRTRVDTQDDNYRKLAGRMELQDVQGRLKDVVCKSEDAVATVRQQAERIEELETRLHEGDAQLQAQREDLVKVQDACSALGELERMASWMNDLDVRLMQVTLRLDEEQQDSSSRREENGALVPQLQGLMSAVAQVSPKINALGESQENIQHKLNLLTDDVEKLKNSSS
eukprot:TRINITY_DN81988_c0_g1_i1.p1 TRINITY_DN81988_c0_g1~~TRINITY_DN81988_c0_g1_i1.p1  ORF type:complete len:512 (-),score=106.82 TRINITY_DN81988_c0_g1_i1:101-1636(-)